MRLTELSNEGVIVRMDINPGTPRKKWFDWNETFWDSPNSDAFIVVFPDRLDSFAGSQQDLLDAARWIGRPVGVAGKWSFEVTTMPGLWEMPGGGVRIVGGTAVSASTWTNLMNTVDGATEMGSVQVSGGATSATLGTDVDSSTPALDILRFAGGELGVSWKLDRQGRVVWSETETDIWPDVPDNALLDVGLSGATKLAGGSKPLLGRIENFRASITHWALNTSYRRGSGSFASSLTDTAVFRTLKSAQTWPGTRYVDAGSIDTTAGQDDYVQDYAADRASSLGPFYSFDFIVDDLQTPAFDPEPGDSVWVFSQDYDIADTSWPYTVTLAGEERRPRKMYVKSVEADRTDNMTVAILNSQSGDWEDITPYVSFAIREGDRRPVKLTLVSEKAQLQPGSADVAAPFRDRRKRALVPPLASQPRGPLSSEYPPLDGAPPNPYSGGGPVVNDTTGIQAEPRDIVDVGYVNDQPWRADGVL